MIYAKAGVILSLFLTIAAAATETIVDLSVDLEKSPDYNDSTGAGIIAQVAADNPSIRTAVILEHGKIVAEYVRDDVGVDEPYATWSTTKSWISLLIGLLVESGDLSLDETLYDVFPDDTNVWSNVTAEKVDFLKNTTIRSMLTMSSGLIEPVPLAESIPVSFDGGTAGGASLTDSLSFPAIAELGTFAYLGISNIMSYVIQERSGMSPREYLAENVLPSLGATDEDIGWWQNEGGMEYSYHGLQLKPDLMAKFGQLYLQDGMASPDNQLVSSEWVSDSSYPHVNAAIEVPGQPPFYVQYGYLFWLHNETSLGADGLGEFYCAMGAGGQDICIHKELDRVSIQQTDLVSLETMGNLLVAPVAFHKDVSFVKGEVQTENGDTEEGDSGSDVSGAKWLRPTLVALLLMSALFVL